MFQASENMQAEGRSIHFYKNVQKTSRNLGPILQVLPLSKGLFKIAEVTPPHIRNYCCFVLIWEQVYNQPSFVSFFAGSSRSPLSTVDQNSPLAFVMGTTTKGVILCSVFCLVQAIISIVLPQIYLWCSMLLTITYYFFCPPNLYVGCNVTPLSTWHFNGNHGHDFNSQITSTGKDVWLSLVGIWSFMQFYTMHFKIDLIFCCEMRICTTNCIMIRTRFWPYPY